MRNVLVMVLMLSGNFIFAQTKPGELQQEVQKTIVAMFQGSSDRDFDKLKANCENDLLVLENGVIWNLDSLHEKINQNKLIADFKRINSFEFIDTKVDKDVAWTTYINLDEVTKNGQHGFIKWMETAVLVKDDKVWKIKVLHSTVLKRS